MWSDIPSEKDTSTLESFQDLNFSLGIEIRVQIWPVAINRPWFLFKFLIFKVFLKSKKIWKDYYFQTIKLEERLLLILIVLTFEALYFFQFVPNFFWLVINFLYLRDMKKGQNTFLISGQSCTLVWNAKYEIRILNGF